MTKQKFTILLSIIVYLGLTVPANSQPTSNQITFSFTLPISSKTSAGVFKSDGTLLRTLWSGVDYSAGNFTEKWDGLNDSGFLVPPGNYNIKVLSNNVTYRWEGVIGNTSTNRTGPNHYNAQDVMWGLAISGNNAYFGTGYNEQQSSSQKFIYSSPQAKIDVLGKGAEITFVTTDGNYVYWGGFDPNANSKSFVFVTKVSDDLEATLSSATQYQSVNGRKYTSAIDMLTSTSASITGLAVQHSGSYLFVARASLNQIDVVNKTTGAKVRTISMSNPTGLAVDVSGNLWIISGTIVRKYPVNTNGTLSSASITLTGLAAPLAIAVSPDNSTVSVCEGGTSQQVKSYSNSSGLYLWTLGQAGGYVNSPAVANDKFMFYDVGNIHSFITYAPDGSFWIGDAGNDRTLHFTANRTYINVIMWHGCSYNVRVDKNNPTRVFNSFLEYAVDYSKPLDNGINGSWKLVNNWQGNLNLTYNDGYNRLLGVTTLSNKRTYCLSISWSSNQYEIVELTSTGLRYTGVIVKIPNKSAMLLYPDGSFRAIGLASVGSSYSFSKATLSGFDASGNPSWGAFKTLATTPIITAQDAAYSGNATSLQPGEVTTSGIYIAFNADSTSNVYHLEGLTSSGNWAWKSALSTYHSYVGDYPTDGAFDVGNNVNGYAGSRALVLGNNILWGYHGEFWKNTEVNKWTMVHDDGLLVGTFGVMGKDSVQYIPFTGMAGNSFCGNLIYNPLDSTSAYLYHNDESVHGGIHRWKISGLNTINEQTIPVVVSLSLHGLLGSYFTGTDLNNTNLSLSRVDNIINAIVAPTGTGSSRWTGFIKPNYSENYTFYANTSSGLLLWVNDSLIINKWSGGSATYSSISLPLIAGNLYSIRLETINGSNVSLGWSSKSLLTQIIPTANLYPAAAVDTTNGINLLENLSYKSIFTKNMYGWTRTPLAEDYTSSSQYWSVSTNVKVYNEKYPDLYTKFSSNSGIYTLSRDLGTNNTTTSWTLVGELKYEGNFPNQGTGGGAYLEVLDRAGKIISRFFPSGGAFPISYIYGNNQVITQSTDAALKISMAATLPINITATINGITFTYSNYLPITAPIFDPTANWKQPQTMRLYFFGNGKNYTRIIDIQSMRFVTDRTLTNPNPNFYRSANTANSLTTNSAEAYAKDQGVKIEWTTQTEINPDHYEIEKSTDGKQFLEAVIIRAKVEDSTKINHNWFDKNAVKGNNYYRIKYVAKTGEVLYSNIVIVKINEKKGDFQIYPNPAKSNYFNLLFNEVNKGIYRVKLISFDGQTLTSKVINHLGGSATETIYIKNSLSKGIYRVYISGEKSLLALNLLIQ